MLTNEERIAAMHKRAKEIERKKRARSGLIAGGAGAVLSLALLIFMAGAISGLSLEAPGETMPEGLNASIFSGSPALGYIFIGVTAFLLGAAVTIFCYRLSALRRFEQGEEDRR